VVRLVANHDQLAVAIVARALSVVAISGAVPDPTLLPSESVGR